MFLAVLTLSSAARAQVDTALGGGLRLSSPDDSLEQLQLSAIPADGDQAGPQLELYLTGYLSWTPTATLSLETRLDSGLLRLGDQPTAYGVPLGEYARDTLFLSELYLEVRGKTHHWSLQTGKFLTSVGGGFIYDYYGIGLQGHWDADRDDLVPLEVEGEVLLPDATFTSAGKRSPLINLSLTYPLSFIEEITLFGAYFHDGDDGLAQSVDGYIRQTAVATALRSTRATEALQRRCSGLKGRQRAVCLAEERAELKGALDQELTVTSRADLFWIGLQANRYFEYISFSGLAIAELGWMEFGYQLDQASLPSGLQNSSLAGARSTSGRPIRAFLVNLDATLHLHRTLGLAPFLLYTSGRQSGDGGSDPFTGFIAVLPYTTTTNLFFQGGINENMASRTTSMAGVNARGVRCAGLRLTWTPTPDLSLEATSAGLMADSPNEITGGYYYGWENDLEMRYTVGTHLLLSAEADYLLPGDFYPPGSTAAYRLVVGVDLVLP